MGLTKRTYTDNVTVITAQNLNDIQDAIIALETAPSQVLSEAVKQALLQLAQKVAYIDDQGQTYYQDLYNALYPPTALVSISAVFNQGSAVIYDTASLDDLKQYLTVTATYDDSTSAVVTDYTLSGTLTAGTSTVTVSYGGKTTTFTVNVTAAPTLSSISAVYTQSGTVYDTDTIDSLKADLVVTAHYSDSSTQTVPSADYTLSGTLTVGTSTITVSYGGKTTTFNVMVTDHRQVPTDYTWLYEAKNGTLLRNDSFITFASNSAANVTEEITSDLLYIKTIGSDTNAQYKLNDTTTSNGVLSWRGKLLTCGVSGEGDGRCVSNSLSNGTAGANVSLFFENGLISVITWLGSADSNKTKYTTNIPSDAFHIFELSYQNGAQTLKIDGEIVFTSTTLSAFFTTMNRFMVHNKSTIESSVYVDWIAYKEG